MPIRYVCINSFYVIAATDYCYLLWSYSTQKATYVSGKIAKTILIARYQVFFL